MQAADLLATPAWILSFLRVAAASISCRVNSRLLVDDDRSCFQSSEMVLSSMDSAPARSQIWGD